MHRILIWSVLVFMLAGAVPAADITADFDSDTVLPDDIFRITGPILIDVTGGPVDVSVSAGAKLSIASGGSLTVQGGGFDGLLRNFGTIVVDAGGTLETDSSSRAGITNFAAGILDIYGTLLQNGASNITNYGMLIIRDGAAVDTSITNSGAVGFESGASNNAAALASALAGTSGSVQIYGNAVTGGYTAQGGWTGTLFTGLAATVSGVVDLKDGNIYLGGILANSGIAHPSSALTITFTDAIHSTNANGIVFGANVNTAVFQNAVNSTMLVEKGKTAVIETANGILGNAVTLLSDGEDTFGTIRFNTASMTGAHLEISAARVAAGANEYGTAELSGTAAGSGISLANIDFSSMAGGVVKVNLSGTAAALNSLDAGGAQIAVTSNVTFSGTVTTASSQTDRPAIDINASNVIFDGDVITTGVSDSDISLAANAYAIFNADVTSAAGLTIGAGAVGMFSGTVATADGITVDGGTMTTGGSGAALSGAGLTLQNGGVLAINEKSGDAAVLDLAGQSITFRDTSSVIVSTAVTEGPLVIGFTDYTGFIVEGRTFAGSADVDAYLQETYSSPGIVRNQAFGFTGTEITYSVSEKQRDEARLSLAGVFEKAGKGDLIHTIRNGAAGLAYDVVKANMDNAALAGSGSIQFTTQQSQLYADIITSAYQSGAASNGIVVSRGEVEAITNHFFGLDLGRTIYTSVNTAMENKAAVLDRVGRNNRLRRAAEEELCLDTALSTPAAAEADSANRFWFAGFGRWEDAGRRNGDAGYTYNSGGILTGYDRVSGDITYGGTFGYTYGNYKDKAALDSSSSIDSYAFAAYGTYNHMSGLFITGMTNYIYTDYDIATMFSTQAGWDTAKYQAGTFSIGVGAGYEWVPQNDLVISASAGVYHYYAETDLFETTFREEARVKYGQTELPLDLAVSHTAAVGETDRLTLFASLGFAYNFNTSGPETSFTFSGMQGAPGMYMHSRRDSHLSWNLGGGFRYAAEAWDAGVRYEYSGRAQYGNHRVVAAAGFSF